MTTPWTFCCARTLWRTQKFLSFSRRTGERNNTRMFGSKKKHRFAHRLDKEMYKEMYRQKHAKIEDPRDQLGDSFNVKAVAALAVAPIVMYGLVYVFADESKRELMKRNVISSQRFQRDVDDK